MFYVGYSNTIAAFHTEDAQLESLNYLFEGVAKQWLIIPGLWSAPVLGYFRRMSLLVDFFNNKKLVLPPGSAWGDLLHSDPITRLVCCHNRVPPGEFL
jgi:hypothetical protein